MKLFGRALFVMNFFKMNYLAANPIFNEKMKITELDSQRDKKIKHKILRTRK